MAGIKIKIDGLYCLHYVRDGKSVIHPKLFTSKDDIYQTVKVLCISDYNISGCFIDEED